MERTAHLAATGMALALLASLTACTETDAEKPRSSGEQAASAYVAGFVDVVEPAGEPESGGVLTFADYSEPRTLDPVDTVATGASGGAPLAAVYDVLVRFDDATGEYEPWLAESIEPDEAGTTWTLDLREGVTFSDGSTMEAADVTGSIQRYIDAGGSDAAVLAKNIASMSAPDDDTVVFDLRKPWSTFPRMLALGAGMIVAPAAYAGKEFDPIGAGPFVLESHAPGEELVLTARADYWGGAPYLDGLRFVWLNGGQNSLESLRAGEVDLTFLREPNVVADARRSQMPGYLALLNLGNTLWINNREGRPGSDLRVRKAIAYAMDAAVDMTRTYAGEGLPTKNMFGPESRWSTGGEQIPVDREQATKLLDEAKADGYDGKLNFVGGATPTGRTEAVAVKAMLESVGFEVETDLLSSIADRIQRMYMDHDFDIAIGSGSVSETDPFHQLNDNLASDSFLNVTGWSSPQMDGLLDQLQAATDDDERRRVIGEIQDLWTDEVPAVNLATFAHLLTWAPKVHGVVPDAEYMMLFSKAWLG